jgi:hypothetical protein
MKTISYKQDRELTKEKHTPINEPTVFHMATDNYDAVADLLNRVILSESVLTQTGISIIDKAYARAEFLSYQAQLKSILKTK